MKPRISVMYIAAMAAAAMAGGEEFSLVVDARPSNDAPPAKGRYKKPAASRPRPGGMTPAERVVRAAQDRRRGLSDA